MSEDIGLSPDPPKVSVADAIDNTLADVFRMPVFMAGSAVAARGAGSENYSDIDLFCPTQQVLISTGQHLLDQGYVLDDRFSRVWERWLRYGMKKWHTNSLRLHSLQGVEVNVVYKLTDGHPTTSLGQVLESFDFGLLGLGVDVEHGLLRDLRPYLFPGWDLNGPLPMMPAKRNAWRNGFISQYNGIREAGRYAKYHSYGFDMSAVKDDLVTGYDIAAAYHLGQFDNDKQVLGQIYATISDRIKADDIDELAESYRTLDFNDELDRILEALE